MKLKQNFSCYDFDDQKKVRVTTLEFGGYALVDFHIQLQRFYQGRRNVEDYYKEIEVSLIKAQIEESQEATISRFLHGLNKDI
ncbi:hypothetical protein CR513_30661, partial [Mucuna pruriens]